MKERGHGDPDRCALALTQRARRRTVVAPSTSSTPSLLQRTVNVLRPPRNPFSFRLTSFRLTLLLFTSHVNSPSMWYVNGNSHRITEGTKKASISFDQDRPEHPVSRTYPDIAPPSLPCRPESSIMIDGRFEGPLTENQTHHGTGQEITKGGRCMSPFSPLRRLLT
jgi:hypothetical protein